MDTITDTQGPEHAGRICTETMALMESAEAAYKDDATEIAMLFLAGAIGHEVADRMKAASRRGTPSPMMDVGAVVHDLHSSARWVELPEVMMVLARLLQWTSETTTDKPYSKT